MQLIENDKSRWIVDDMLVTVQVARTVMYDRQLECGGAFLGSDRQRDQTVQ